MNIKIVVLFIGLFVGVSTFAEDTWKDVQLNGFISQSYVSSNNDYRAWDENNC